MRRPLVPLLGVTLTSAEVRDGRLTLTASTDAATFELDLGLVDMGLVYDEGAADRRPGLRQGEIDVTFTGTSSRVEE